MRRWFYFAQQDPPDDRQTNWHGSNELARWSSVVLKQRQFIWGPIRFFYGQPQVELELIWRWSPHAALPASFTDTERS